MRTYPTEQDKELITAVSRLEGNKEATAFLRDLLTPAEIEELSSRFQIAKLLWITTLSYIDIAKKMGTSTTTVTRVSQWLFKEPWQGYSAVLKRMYGLSKR